MKLHEFTDAEDMNPRQFWRQGWKIVCVCRWEPSNARAVYRIDKTGSIPGSLSFPLINDLNPKGLVAIMQESSHGAAFRALAHMVCLIDV